MYSTRPTNGELDKKIRGAKFALSTQNGLFARPEKVVGKAFRFTYRE